MELIATLGGWGVAILLAVVALLPKKGSLEHQMIDQQQERIESLEGRLDRLEPDLSRERLKNVAWERREGDLMSGVERGVYPPWPPRTGILSEGNQ